MCLSPSPSALTAFFGNGERRGSCPLFHKCRFTSHPILCGSLLNRSPAPLATLQCLCSLVGLGSPWQKDSATAVDGCLLCRVAHRSTTLQVTMSGNHSETLTFHLIHAPQQLVILGYPWLKRHNPHIDWASGTILQWSVHCHTVCLRSALSSALSLPVTSDFPDISGVPKDYLDLKEVLTKPGPPPCCCIAHMTVLLTSSQVLPLLKADSSPYLLLFQGYFHQMCRRVVL